MKVNSTEGVENLPSTSKQSSNNLSSAPSCSNNHMPQLSELLLAGGTVHTDRLLPQIEELSAALKNFAPALKRLRLPICSNYIFKVRSTSKMKLFSNLYVKF